MATAAIDEECVNGMVKIPLEDVDPVESEAVARLRSARWVSRLRRGAVPSRLAGDWR